MLLATIFKFVLKFEFDPDSCLVSKESNITNSRIISINAHAKRWTDCCYKRGPHPGQIHFIIFTCSNDQVDHPFPADGITVFDRGRCFDRVAIQQMLHFVIIRPSNDPPPYTTFSTPSLWKLADTRDKRCASPCPVSIDLIFRHFPWTNTKQNRDPLDSITIGYFNFFVSLFGRWSELLENFCQVYRCNWYGVWSIGGNREIKYLL